MTATCDGDRGRDFLNHGLNHAGFGLIPLFDTLLTLVLTITSN